MRLGALFLVGLLAAATPARADDASTPVWRYSNPFCAAIASVISTGEPGRYAVGLFTAAGTTIDAHVTLIGQTDAYDAYVTSPLGGSPGNRQSAGVITTVPPDARIAWSYVDSYAIDGGTPVSCPSYVFPVEDRTVHAPEGTRTIAAARLQALPALRCGHIYTQPGLRHDLESPISSRYGIAHSLTVIGKSYLDSNGYSVREEIVQSSGDAGFDAYMLGVLHTHQFSPAQFLCTPVVGTIEVRLKVGP